MFDDVRREALRFIYKHNKQYYPEPVPEDELRDHLIGQCSQDSIDTIDRVIEQLANPSCAW